MTAFERRNSIPFGQWLRNDSAIRYYLLVSVILTTIQFAAFKWYYPQPNFFPDSYSYLEAAYWNKDINMWPIGYSKFIRLFSVFTHSDTALIYTQYFLLQVSALYFLLTLVYLFNPGKLLTLLLLAFGTLNPITLHLSNFISSDALFTGLSMVWITQLIRIIYQPTKRLLLWHAIVLLLVFTVRYNSLYYPVISLLIISLSKTALRAKITGIVAILALTGGFAGYTFYHYKKTTGIVQFSAFGGWQMASNALYMYAHLPQEPSTSFPSRLKELHTIVSHHMDSLNHVKIRPDTALGVYYLWNPNAPLLKYLELKWSKDTSTDYFQKWAAMAPLYGDYGSYLIRKHPAAFVRYYILPNLINYYVPGTEFLGTYNMGRDTVDQIAKVWFDYKTNKTKSPFKDHKILITEYYSIIAVIINLGFALGFIGFLLLDGFKKTGTLFSTVLLLWVLIWIANLLFSVLASPIVLRYQVFSMTISFPFALLLIKFLLNTCGIGRLSSPGNVAYSMEPQ